MMSEWIGLISEFAISSSSGSCFYLQEQCTGEGVGKNEPVNGMETVMWLIELAWFRYCVGLGLASKGRNNPKWDSKQVLTDLEDRILFHRKREREPHLKGLSGYSLPRIMVTFKSLLSSSSSAPLVIETSKIHTQRTDEGPVARDVVSPYK